MQIRVITRSCKESCFVGTTTRFVSHRAYGNYPKGDNDRVDKWKNRRNRSEATTVHYGVLESFEFCFTDSANLGSFARALPRGAFEASPRYSYVELGNLGYRQRSVQSV